jgi:hypothetical protein
LVHLAINPLGRVPALVTPSHGTITEVPAVLCYIADQAADQELLPGTLSVKSRSKRLPVWLVLGLLLFRELTTHVFERLAISVVALLQSSADPSAVRGPV